MAACQADSKICTAHSLDKSSLPIVHEQTPLLACDPTSTNRLKSEVSPLQKGSGGNDPHLLEAQPGNVVSDLSEGGRGPKTAANVASVLPVLLLGARARHIVSFRCNQLPEAIRSRAVHIDTTYVVHV